MQHLLTLFYNLTESIGYPNYGLAIILLTIAIKTVMYPLTVSQIKSMKEMAFIQPKIKELQEKYKGSPEKLNKEMAELYRSHSINPLSGCLPLIVQMPFLIAIFYAIRDYQYATYPSFLWLKENASYLWLKEAANYSLATPDPLYILPVLSAAATYLQTKMTTSPEQMQQQKMMLMFMPLFILWISIKFPAGLVLYWAVSTVIQIIQQYYLYKQPYVIQGEANK